MAKMTECIFGERTIDIEEALALRAKDKENSKEFLCTECGESVRAHKGSQIAEAHFEHAIKNESCPYWSR